MTDLDVRKIAEKINRDRVCGVVSTRDIDTAALLSALVEERAKAICGNWNLCRHQGGQRLHRTQALDELNLKDVWPVKEE